MTRSPFVSVLAAAMVPLALAFEGSARAATQDVSIQSTVFGPAQVSALVGDTVSWHNASLKQHTVTARDGTFGSPHIGLGGGYSQAFPTAGSFPYYCQLHPFMTGEVDVYDVLLHGPADPVSPGEQVPLDGRARLGISSVEIQEDAGSGFQPVATATVDVSGDFHASVPAAATAQYRAVAGATVSPAVRVIVMDRQLIVHASPTRVRGRRRFDLVRVRAVPRDPGAIVLLQLDLRERFGWWPTSRRKLDSTSTAVFKAPAGARARVALTLPDGWTPIVTGAPLRLPR